MPRRTPRSTLFPYTTLFRSGRLPAQGEIEIRLSCHWHAEASDESQTNRSEEHTSELQSHSDLVCRLLLEKKKQPVQWAERSDPGRGLERDEQGSPLRGSGDV